MDIKLFIFSGLFLSIAMSFLGLIFTVEIKNTKIRIIVAIIISLILGFSVSAAMVKQKTHQDKIWNNGTCPKCGSHWEFKGGDKRGSDCTYYYSCENGHVFESNTIYQQK